MHVLKTCCILITFLYAFSAQGQKSDSSDFEILVYGFRPNNTYRNAEGVVASRWGISFKSVATCLISQPLKDSADLFNKHTDSLISLKYGENWRQKFEKEIEVEEQLLEKLIQRIKMLDYISQLDSTLEKQNNDLYYLIYPYPNSRSEKRYEIFVYGWGSIDEQTDLVCYYKFKMHKNRKNIELITDKPSFLFK